MRKSAIDHMILMADDFDCIVFITSIYNPIPIKKANLVYAYMDYCIRIRDKYRKEDYMIQLESLQGIKIKRSRWERKIHSPAKSNVKIGA